MAKLNWQRVQVQSKAQTALENDRADHRKWKNKLIMQGDHWIVGKYKGTLVKKLPIHYLCYVSENFAEGDIYKQRADSELRRRYKLLNN